MSILQNDYSNHKLFDDFNFITEDLAVGNIYAGSDLDLLLDYGIDVIVSSTPYIPLELDLYSKKGFSLLHIPLLDTPNQDIIQWFDIVNDFIQSHHNDQRKVLVHCAAGISRSATLAASFLMQKYGWSMDHTLGFMQKKRNIINPNYNFRKQLIKYESQLK